jgi:hypothetical protein
MAMKISICHAFLLFYFELSFFYYHCITLVTNPLIYLFREEDIIGYDMPFSKFLVNF